MRRARTCYEETVDVLKQQKGTTSLGRADRMRRANKKSESQPDIKPIKHSHSVLLILLG